MRTRLKLGQWNAICDRCGFKFKSGELKKDWQGLMVCNEDFELRNPQDFLRIQPERVVPDWVRPRPPDIFIENLGLFDKVEATSGEGFVDEGQDYVNPTYFAEDYILDRFFTLVLFNRTLQDTVSISDDVIFSVQKATGDVVLLAEDYAIQTNQRLNLQDTLFMSDNGTVVLSDYVDVSYFAESYVGTVTSF
jgi:hypothetical protein